jgi:hypothetical protein
VNTYEIRILFKDKKPSAIFASSYISDQAAVRRP